MEQRGIEQMNRMGVIYYNSKAELDRFMDCLKSILHSGLREKASQIRSQDKRRFRRR